VVRTTALTAANIARTLLLFIGASNCTQADRVTRLGVSTRSVDRVVAGARHKVHCRRPPGSIDVADGAPATACAPVAQC
jgi:hypothetical protein